jgi:hypothetical protein
VKVRYRVPEPPFPLAKAPIRLPEGTLEDDDDSIIFLIQDMIGDGAREESAACEGAFRAPAGLSVSSSGISSSSGENGSEVSEGSEGSEGSQGSEGPEKDPESQARRETLARSRLELQKLRFDSVRALAARLIPEGAMDEVMDLFDEVSWFRVAPEDEGRLMLLGRDCIALCLASDGARDGWSFFLETMLDNRRSPLSSDTVSEACCMIIESSAERSLAGRATDLFYELAELPATPASCAWKARAAEAAAKARASSDSCDRIGAVKEILEKARSFGDSPPALHYRLKVEEILRGLVSADLGASEG